MRFGWQKITYRSIAVLSLVAIIWVAKSEVGPLNKIEYNHPVKKIEISDNDTIDLPWPNQDDYYPEENTGGISLPLPDNIQYNMEYDPETGQYVIVQTVGDSLNFRNPSQLSLDEYMDFQMSGNLSEYWTEIQQEKDEEERAFAPSLNIDSERFKKIFGSDEISIRPQGSAELTFGIDISKTENPRIPERQRTIRTFDFDQKIQLNVTGNIGTKMQLNTNFNTEATFDFENQMKLEYTGDEDEIIKKIEAGHVGLPLQGTLIQGASNVFGLKLETQWGKLRNTTVFSQQKSERKEIQVEGGAQTQTFEVGADSYDANRHFFLSNWFRDQYDGNMASLPIINSGIQINRIEVYIVNRQANTQDVRNVLGFTDIGESDDYISEDLNMPGAFGSLNPDNGNNDIYNDMITNPNVMSFNTAVSEISMMPAGYNQGFHYERIGNARKLDQSEFTFNSRLGFISLRQSLNNDEVLACSYEYTYNGQTYKVGTLSQDGFAAPDALILKLLKASITNVESPIWDLMMKNVYNLGAFGIQRDNFRLEVWYNNPATGIDQNYISREPLDGKMLIQVLNMDRLDVNNNATPDGVFDYVDNAATQGGLINSQNGRVFLPVVEPFGEHLASKIIEGLPGNADQAEQVINDVVFQELYDNTKTFAQQIPSKNRFTIRGQYQSSSGSEINLNAFNIPKGSVVVTAGGNKLIENQDYTVDYNLGRVRILNEGILQSGTPISISLESNALFSFQSKTLLGSRFDYTFNENLAIGGTILNLRERPLTQKVNIGDEPVNNTQIGIDMKYQKEAPWLTRAVDRIPLIDTKAPSNIDFSAEAARYFPGHSRAIGKEGNAYLDDFEGSQSVIDIRSVNQWFMASTPQYQPSLFPEGEVAVDDVRFGYNRAKLSWYTIDASVYLRRNDGLTPDDITDDVRSDHRMREILEAEVFPSKELATGVATNIATLDLTYYPDERGPYNYELPNGSAFSDGLDFDSGNLLNPSSRWGGIQRALTTTDFETSNVEYIQFWLMDPFNEDSDNITGGDLYFNLGNVSEDVLYDSNLAYENGLPTSNNPLETVTSTWGVFPSPSTFNVVNAFDNTTGNYEEQDIGLDGLNSAAERTYFAEWLAEVQANLSNNAYNNINADPSADDYRYHRGEDSNGNEITGNTLERYRDFNNNEGNADISAPGGVVITATTIPNTEDINQNISLDNVESYFQYKVSLKPSDLGPNNVGSNFITSTFDQEIENLPNGEDKNIRWYQFKIPIREFEQQVGSINDFRSIRFIRMFMKDWEQEVTLRFARLELVRGEWRQFIGNLEGAGEGTGVDPNPTSFNISTVNVEEHEQREPIGYVIPDGIIRETDLTSPNGRQINEQSLSLEVCNLTDGDARAAYRNVNFDMRLYENLKMFVHAEAADDFGLNDDDVTCFIRLGSDFTDNYYEYEIPLKVTPDNSSTSSEIWPEENEIDVELSKLQGLKIARPSSFSLLTEYVEMDGDARMTIKGNPTLAKIVTIMVGVRNVDKDNNPFSSDDGLNKCAIVWVNELRMNGFNEKGGWAAVARANATLADFGTFQMAGNISTPGWGSLEQSIQDRQQETIVGFDANSTLQLGKFFPEEMGITLPMYVGYSETVSTPRYDPLALDIELNDRDLSPGRKKKAQDFTKLRSINFSNVKIAPQPKQRDPKPDKNKDKEGKEGKEGKDGKDSGKGKGKDDGGKKKKTPFYSISNFSFSYGYSEMYHRDINMEFVTRKDYNGGLNYNFTNKTKEIKPFAKIPVIKDSKYLKWLKEFNFYPGIKSFSFRTTMDRTYETTRIRNNTFDLYGFDSDVLIQTQVLKTWNWNRQYNLKYDITKSLKFDFNANNAALVGEPVGLIDRDNQDYHQAYKDTVWSNIQNFGETTNYDHNAGLSYKVPFDKFPLIDFLSTDIRYNGTYAWDRAPFSQDTLGNTIQNTRVIGVTPQANFLTLYNKIPLLKKINSGKRDSKKPKGKLSNDDVDGFGNAIDKKEQKEKIKWGHEALRFLMMVRNVSGSYNRNEGILMPGYNQSTSVLGMDPSFNGPGFGFLVGHQYDNITGSDLDGYAQFAVENGWVEPLLTQPTMYAQTYAESWSLRAKLEPIKDFDIELTANRNESVNTQSFISYDELLDTYSYNSTNEVGSFTASVITWPTAFIKDDEDFSSEVFDNFLDNRGLISSRVNNATYNLDAPEDDGYYTGWGPTSQEVVVPSFIAAYTGRSANDVNLDVFGTKVAPNWDIKYDGLSKNKKFKKIFNKFSIDHAYSSSVSASYLTNLSYEENPDNPGLPNTFDLADHPNYITSKQISSVNITESFSPLVGFDMTIKTKTKTKKKKDQNEISLKIEFKKDRTVNLGLANFQITETRSEAFVIGGGYKIANVPNPFGRAKKSKLPVTFLKNTQLELRADVTIRDNVTIIRRMVEEQNQVTAGQKLISIKTSADMNLTDKVTIRFFYDQQLTRPKISTSFPTSNISSGIALRFQLS